MQIVIDVDSGKATTKIKSLKKELGGMAKQADDASKSTSSLSNAIGGLAIGATAIAALKGITNAGMDMQRIMNTLQVGTGDAAKSFEFVSFESDRLGLSLKSTAEAYSKFSAAAKGSSLEGDAANKIFSAVATASTAMGLSADQSQGALRALEQMISKGNVQAEELRGQLGERLPGAFQLAAKSMGVTTKELNKMLDKGDVLAVDLLPKLADTLNEEFGEGAKSAAHNARQELNRLNTSFFELGNAIAESGVLSLVSELASDMAKFTKNASYFIGTFKDGGTRDLAAAVENIGNIKEQIAKTEAYLEGKKDSILPDWMNAGGISWAEDRLKKLRAELKQNIDLVTNAPKTSPALDIPAGDSGSDKTDNVLTKQQQLEQQRTEIAINAARERFDALSLIAQQAGDDEETRAIDAFQQKIDRMEAEKEFLIQKGADRVELERQADENRVLLAADLENQILAIRKQEADKEAQIEKDKNDKITEIEKMAHYARLSLTANGLGAVANLVEVRGKKAFEFAKALRAGEIVLSTIASAQKAYESQLTISTPDAPIRAAAAATIAGIQGAARLAALNAASMGGGSVPTSSAGSSSATTSSYSPTTQPIPSTQQTTTTQSTMNISMKIEELTGNESPAVLQQLTDMMTPAIVEQIAAGGTNVSVV